LVITPVMARGPAWFRSDPWTGGAMVAAEGACPIERCAGRSWTPDQVRGDRGVAV